MSKLIKLLTVLIFLSLTGCSTQKLYDIAINYERDRADLVLKTENLNFGNIAYLDNNFSSQSTIVLLHGFGGDKDNWNRFSSALKLKSHIIIPDLPGHGNSVSNDKLDFSIAHQTEMLSSFLKAINARNIHLVGNSMGGAIAISYATTYSENVKSLTLIDSLGLKAEKSEFDTIIKNSGNNPMLNVCTKDAFEQLLSLGMENPPYVPGIFLNKLAEAKCARSKLESKIFYDMMKDSDLSNIISKIKTPTLIIWGKKDRVLHINNANLFHNAIKGSQLTIFEEAGHVPLLEVPRKTAVVFEKFIKNKL